MNEEAWATDYLVTYLGADATLSALVSGIWKRQVPESAPMPAVKMDVLERSDLMVIGLTRVWADLRILVRGIAGWRSGAPADWAEANAIGDRIDALLHDHEASSANLQISSYREESFTDETVEGGSLYLHNGGIYRFFAHAL